MSFSEVSNILWRERRRVGQLVYKLEVQQLLLASGRTRRLADARREVEHILDGLRRVELERAVAVAGATSDLGLPESLSLRELAALAPSPWDGILDAHRDALLVLVREMNALRGDGHAAREPGPEREIDLGAYDGADDGGGDPSPAVSPDGRHRSECSSRARRRRREGGAVQPSLADFLR